MWVTLPRTVTQRGRLPRSVLLPCFNLVWFGSPPLLLGPSEPIQRRHSSGHNSEVHKHPPAPLIEIVVVPGVGHLEYKKLL